MKDEVLLAALAGLLHDVGHSQKGISDFLPPRWQEALGQIPEALAPLASQLSAGESKPEGQTEAQPGKPGQLQSIFCTVAAKGKRTPDKKYLPLGALKLNRQTIFPDEPLPDNAVQEQYKTLWDDFAEEAKALKAAYETTGGMESYIESMLALLHRFGWCIPAARHSALADVSLYDHSRMTAALAAVLAEVDEDRLQAIAKDPGSSRDEVALLVGGDISGVQDFIYTISSKGAAKTLRGRSFYLQLLTEAALRFVLNRLELPYTNVIYSGGGNFFLLAPLEAKEKLPALRADLSRILLKHHGSALYMALGFAEVPAMGFKAGELPKYWSAMHKAIQQAKHRRYSELGGDAYALVFEPPKLGGNANETCSICGDDQRKTRKWDELEVQERTCELCFSFADEIGKHLPKSRFVALGWNEPQEQSRGTASDALAELGMTFQLLRDAKESVTLAAGRVTIWALDDPQNGNYPPANVPAAHVLRYVANQVPPENFDELQEKVKGGFKRLGVIRLDVDDMGKLFKDGLAENATLSRLAALSFQLSLFFEGWMKEICARNGRDVLVYTVYTGGDDAFLLGPWDVMPGLAQDIAREFSEYTGLHPDLHMSTGMSFIGGKYPIYQAAEDAHEALEAAKKSGKDAFNFLGRNWQWESFEILRQRSERLENIVTQKKDGGLDGSQAILHHLQNLAQSAEQHTDGKSRHVWGRWMWLGNYQLFRMVTLAKGEALKDAIGSIKDELHKSSYSDIGQWGAAARWVQLKTRKPTQED